MKRSIPLRPGEYKNCGVTLLVEEGAEGNTITVRGIAGPSLSWVFSHEGVFRQLGASSVPDQVASLQSPSVLLACPHINEEFEGTVVRGVSPGAQMGWICCTDCITEMLAGESTHILDAAIEARVTEKCTVLEATLRSD